MPILRVSMNNKEIVFQDIPKEWTYLGGIAPIARILNQEVPPLYDPLGPDNKLTIACAARGYETIARLGADLGIINNEDSAWLKFVCDDLEHCFRRLQGGVDMATDTASPGQSELLEILKVMYD